MWSEKKNMKDSEEQGQAYINASMDSWPLMATKREVEMALTLLLPSKPQVATYIIYVTLNAFIPFIIFQPYGNEVE